MFQVGVEIISVIVVGSGHVAYVKVVETGLRIATVLNRNIAIMSVAANFLVISHFLLFLLNLHID